MNLRQVKTGEILLAEGLDRPGEWGEDAREVEIERLHELIAALPRTRSPALPRKRGGSSGQSVTRR